VFLIVCLIRMMKNHFTRKTHQGFVFAAWYWNFVDVVWIFLWFVVYWWGSIRSEEWEKRHKEIQELYLSLVS
jgi:heme/copper-type cytochrome/quinol oxidase subunit 3